jgi:uncharacterized protein
MKLHVDRIEESPKRLEYEERVEDLNARLAGGAPDYRFAAPLHVALDYYRAADDVVFDGGIRGAAIATCARCAEEFRLPLDVPVRAVLAPRLPDAAPTGEVVEEDLGLGTFAGDEIDVADLVDEHVILALPTRPLCTEGCRGLCPQCGANLNAGSCGCAASRDASPFAVLRTLERKS